MTDQENVQAIRVAYLALETGNAAKMLAVCTDDVAWIYPGSEALVPVGGEFVGRIGIEAFFELLNEDESIQVITPREFLQHGERIIVLAITAPASNPRAVNMKRISFMYSPCAMERSSNFRTSLIRLPNWRHTARWCSPDPVKALARCLWLA